jgi:hypothetical protein
MNYIWMVWNDERRELIDNLLRICFETGHAPSPRRTRKAESRKMKRGQLPGSV